MAYRATLAGRHDMSTLRQQKRARESRTSNDAESMPLMPEILLSEDGNGHGVLDAWLSDMGFGLIYSHNGD